MRNDIIFERARKGMDQSDAHVYCQTIVMDTQWVKLLAAAKGDNLTIVRHGHLIDITRVPGMECGFDRVNLHFMDMTKDPRFSPNNTSGKCVNFEGRFVFSFNVHQDFGIPGAVGTHTYHPQPSLSFFPNEELSGYVVVRTLNFVLLADSDLSPQELMFKYSLGRYNEHPKWTREKWGRTKPSLWLGDQEYWIWVVTSILEELRGAVEL